MSFHGMRGHDLKRFLDGLTEEQLRSFVYLESHYSGDEACVTGIGRVHASQRAPERIVITDARMAAL